MPDHRGMVGTIALMMQRVLLCSAMVVASCSAGQPHSRPSAPPAPPAPWFAQFVGSATQVVAVQGTGETKAVIDTWQRVGDTWKAVRHGLPADVGAAGFSDTASDDNPATPRGVFSLDYAFGTAPAPRTDLKYVRVDSQDWWDVDSNSPTYNTHQRCEQSSCTFDTSVSENLDAYERAIVMGVNDQRNPRGGAAFFVHATDGGPSAGCVTLDDIALVQLIEWLRPGAKIAIKG